MVLFGLLAHDQAALLPPFGTQIPSMSPSGAAGTTPAIVNTSRVYILICRVGICSPNGIVFLRCASGLLCVLA